MRTQIVLLSLAAACLTFNSTALATDRLVPGQYPTIQAAIDAAVNGDVVIVAPNTYTGTGNRDIDFKGKAITVRSINPNDPNVVAATVIDCQNSGRGFYFHSGEGPNSIVSGLTIKRGEIYDYMARGGGIFCSGSSPTIENCVIRNNSANGYDGGEASRGYRAYGGGICCISGSHPRIFNCIISNNIAEGGKGGIGECGGMWLPAGDGGSGYGGGVYSSYDSQPRIENCTITNNIAMGGSGGEEGCSRRGGDGGNSYGGGIYCSYGTISNCKITDNTVRGGSYGGGSGAYAGAGLGGGVCGQIIINNSIISGNHALRGYSGSVQVPLSGGGGICCTASSSIINCLITSNEATSLGTGIYVLYNGNQSIIKGCTIANNTATYYPAYAVDDRLNMYTVDTTIIDSIIWNHYDYDVSSVCSVTYSCTDQNVAGIGNIHSDPCFVNGPLGDYYLSQIAAGQAVDSPCVDAGSDTAVNLGMNICTTRTDHISDAGIIDMGYHYGSCCLVQVNAADINGQGGVDFIDYVILTSQWKETPGIPLADIAPPCGDGIVNEKDLALLVESWLWGK